jgi:hypothetical protein
VDLSFGTNRYSIGVGAQNLFDTFPDLLIPANSSFVVQTFPGANPFGSMDVSSTRG